MLGHATTVKKVIGEKAILEKRDNKWAFNVKSLLVVAKNSELIIQIDIHLYWHGFDFRYGHNYLFS